MNRPYRVVWNASLGIFQVASERARFHPGPRTGVRPLIAVLTLALGGLMAAPACADGGRGGEGNDANPGGLGGTASSPNGQNGSSAVGTIGGGGGGGGVSLSTGRGGNGGNGGGFEYTRGGSGGALGDSSTTNNGGAISGGAGDAGEPSSTRVGGGGGGGGGGFGLRLDGTGSYANQGTGAITGGAGGAGGSVIDASSESGGGGGGEGGGALLLTGRSSYSNAGTLLGGAGGAGGTDHLTGLGSSGGQGGAGAIFMDGGVLHNTGHITGGAGGAGGHAGSLAAAGDGGAGVAGTGIHVTNAGTISGGLSGGTGAQAAAIHFMGGDNTLTLETGSILDGELKIESGTLSLDQSTDQTLSNRISGGGAVVQNGTGTLTLSGSNNYTGGTIIKMGTLDIGEDRALGESAGGITFEGGTLRVGNGFTSSRHVTLEAGGGTIQTDGLATFSGVIGNGAGAGTLVKTGAGTLTLGGANTYTGGTEVRAGQLNVASGGTLGGTGSVVVGNASGGANATLAFLDGSSAKGLAISNKETGTTSFAGNVATDGTTRIDNAGSLDFTALTTDLRLGALTGAGHVDYGARELTLGQASGDTTYDGVLSATGGLTKTGANTVILNGKNTYSGGTTIDAGTLEIGDRNSPTASIQGDAQVNAGGTLRGHGTVQGNVDNGGTVRPGGSIGTLTIGGNYTQSPSATLRIDVSPTVASQLKVGGTATLNGTLDVLYGPGVYGAKSYRIVDAGAVDGKFATVSGNTPEGFAQDLLYSASAVDLNLTGGFVIAPSNATLFGAMGSALLRDTQRVNGALLERLARTCEPSASRNCARAGQSAWIVANGTFDRIEGNGGAPDVREDRYGFVAGRDRALGAWTVGLAGGYSHGKVREDTGEASGEVDTLRLGAYGARALGAVDIAMTAGYAYDFISTRRDFGSLGNTRGSAHAQEFNAGLQLSRPFSLGTGAITLTPRLGVRYAHLRGLGLDETGLASQRLSVDKQTLDSLQPYMDVSLDYAFEPAYTSRAGHVQARVAYAYETQGRGRDVSVTSGDGTRFVIPGTQDTRGLATVGLGLSLPMGKTATAHARYDTVLPTGNVRSQAIFAGIDFRF